MEETAVAAPPEARQSLQPWYAAGWFGLLLILVYLPTLTRLVDQWANDEDMGHGFFVPAVAAYLVWRDREALLSQSYTSSRWGLLVIAYGAVQMLLALLGVELFLARTAFIISLTGCVLYLGGWGLLRQVAFPLFLLLFMVPIPAIIYNQITFPLQLFASSVAEIVLNAVGVAVLREGNVLELPSQRLSVVEACSGIRSLLSLSFLALTFSALFDPKPWMRFALLVATVPIAITANALRVTLTGLLSEVNPELSKGLFHTMEGWVLFMLGLSMLIGAHRLINAVYNYAKR